MRATRRDRRCRPHRRRFSHARVQRSRARNASSRYVAADRSEARLLAPNARASPEPAASPLAETASVPLQAAFPDESRKGANAELPAILAPLLRPKLSRDNK